MRKDKRKGAISEMFVCADLLAQGWDVFRAISQHCSCDIVALKGGEFRRVEVRSTVSRLDGSPSPSLNRVDDCDWYAFVVDDGTISYIPFDEAWKDRRMRSNSPETPLRTLYSGSESSETAQEGEELPPAQDEA